MKDEIGKVCFFIGVSFAIIVGVNLIVGFIYLDFSIFSNEYFLRMMAVFSVPSAYSGYDIYKALLASKKKGARNE